MSLSERERELGVQALHLTGWGDGGKMKMVFRLNERKLFFESGKEYEKWFWKK